MIVAFRCRSRRARSVCGYLHAICRCTVVAGFLSCGWSFPFPHVYSIDILRRGLVCVLLKRLDGSYARESIRLSFMKESSVHHVHCAVTAREGLSSSAVRQCKYQSLRANGGTGRGPSPDSAYFARADSLATRALRKHVPYPE